MKDIVTGQMFSICNEMAIIIQLTESKRFFTVPSTERRWEMQKVKHLGEKIQNKFYTLI